MTVKIPDEGGRGTKQALHRNTSASTSYDNRYRDRKVWEYGMLLLYSHGMDWMGIGLLQ